MIAGHRVDKADEIHFLLLIINAAITPGTQPASVSKNTMSTEPQPLSSTASGGNKMHNKTLKSDICLLFWG